MTWNVFYDLFYCILISAFCWILKKNTGFNKMNGMSSRKFHEDFQPIRAAGQDLQVQLCWRHNSRKHVSMPRWKLSWVSIDWLLVLNPWLLQNLRHKRGPFKFLKDYRHLDTHSVCRLRFEQDNTVQRYFADRSLQVSVNWLWSYISISGTVNRFLLQVSVHDWCSTAADENTGWVKVSVLRKNNEFS